MFNDGAYEARAQSGELRKRVVKDRHPSAPKANVPYCTRSQEVVYTDRNGHEVVTAHQYLLSNGSLGAGGRPDPKRILKGGILYVAWWEPRKGDR